MMEGEADLEELVTDSNFQLGGPGGNVKLVMDGRQGRAEGRLSFAQLVEYWEMGATVVFDQLERHWPPITNLASQIERWSGVRTEVNMYRTPPNARGFGAHYDFEDVLILQLNGTKRWRVWEPDLIVGQQWLPIKDPRTEIMRSKDYVPSTEPLGVEMQRGDVLYIPRGFPHMAETYHTTATGTGTGTGTDTDASSSSSSGSGSGGGGGGSARDDTDAVDDDHDGGGGGGGSLHLTVTLMDQETTWEKLLQGLVMSGDPQSWPVLFEIGARLGAQPDFAQPPTGKAKGKQQQQGGASSSSGGSSSSRIRKPALWQFIQPPEVSEAGSAAVAAAAGGEEVAVAEEEGGLWLGDRLRRTFRGCRLKDTSQNVSYHNGAWSAAATAAAAAAAGGGGEDGDGDGDGEREEGSSSSRRRVTMEGMLLIALHQLALTSSHDYASSSSSSIRSVHSPAWATDKDAEAFWEHSLDAWAQSLETIVGIGGKQQQGKHGQQQQQQVAIDSMTVECSAAGSDNQEKEKGKGKGKRKRKGRGSSRKKGGGGDNDNDILDMTMIVDERVREDDVAEAQALLRDIVDAAAAAAAAAREAPAGAGAGADAGAEGEGDSVGGSLSVAKRWLGMQLTQLTAAGRRRRGTNAG